jgi:hypothetical protein
MDASGKILSGPGRTYLPVGPAPTVTTGPDGTKAKAKSAVHLPPKKIMKGVGQAIKDWSMIEEGDRLLLGLSGGKDSLALLHILLAVQVSSRKLHIGGIYILLPVLLCFILLETRAGEVRDRLRHGGSADGLVRSLAADPLRAEPGRDLPLPLRAHRGAGQEQAAGTALSATYSTREGYRSMICVDREIRCVRSVQDSSAACSTRAAGEGIFRTWYCVCVNHALPTFSPRTHNYNKLVLAQHLDDLVESFMMSFLHNGQVVFR